MNPITRLKYILIIGWLTTITLSARAQTPVDTLYLSLEDALDLAVKNSYELEIAKNTLEANTLLNHYGVAGGLPTVAGTLSNTEQITNLNQKLNNGNETNKKGATVNNTQAGIAGSILLYNGHRVVAAKKRLEYQQLQSQESLQEQLQNTLASVMASYYDVVRQKSYISTIKTSIAASQKRLEILEVRKEAGMANNSDIFQAQIDLNTLLQTLMEQEMVEKTSKTQLRYIMALDSPIEIAVKDTIVLARNIDLTAILEGLERNPTYQAAERQIQINQQLVKETAALRYPTVRLNLGYNYSRNQSTAGFTLLNQTIGPNASVTVAVPIYNGSVFRRQKQVAELDVQNAKAQKNILLRDYSSEVIKQYETYKSSLEQITIQQENYELSKKLLDLTLMRFELIQATIIDVREAQKSFEEAGYKLVNLNYAAKSAEIELNRLSNQLAN
ncbi:outer membrane protein TolC [Dyadobacter jejuensis]|uniref:Outer membrane protein TolC n=1 Tax=Dyadobacter jejuensis TaxID=1082580 RepID=A0A316B4A2_9BACT|nr:TolC family protein [Dyadobacter jejuensis]PWJ57417.1 outer membrane protein TolC [Dyadobacter jejuensis]